MNKSKNKFHFNRQEDKMTYTSEGTYDAKKEVINDCINNLKSAMGKFNFDGSLSCTDILEIRGHINEARSIASGYADFNADEKGQFKLIFNLADLFEKAINLIDDSDRYI
jgi:hypothetical protein